MPTYKNRKPMAPDTKVWHYTSVEAVIAMLRDRQMRLTRLDAYDDRFEGSVPKKQIDDQLPLFSVAQSKHYTGMNDPQMQMPYRELWEESTQRRRAKTRSAHAMCWRRGEESEAMWKLYCDDGEKGQGLALRSTLDKLEASVARHDLFVSPVEYRFYHEGNAFDDELDPFMHKRKGFEYEQEVRLLKYDEAHFLALSSLIGGYATVAPPDELPKYNFLDWSLTDAIDAITVSPYASEAYETKARDAIAAIDPVLVERMELSVLSERRYAPNY